MLKNYLKIAVRNLLKYRGYSLINICGLAIGIACCLLIALWVIHELSYDRFHAQADRIYRVAEIFRENGKIVEESASIPFPVGPTILVLAGLLAFGVALLTVSFQALKAALTNPVEALRYE